MQLRCVAWSPSGALSILDQTLLPLEERWLELDSVQAVVEAIRSLRVRGAPAIGVAAAMGLVASLERSAGLSRERLLELVDGGAQELSHARPTAVNLGWAMERMRRAAQTARGDGPSVLAALRSEAEAIRAEDEAMCRAMGEHGQSLLEPLVQRAGNEDRPVHVLTHCNTGALATAGIGTALAVIYVADERGVPLHVWVDETRPLLQGARLTAWELAREGIGHTVIPDGAAASLMRRGQVDIVLVGADRIAKNGDVANKVGTYPLAIAARSHGVPLHVVAPSSSFDPHCPSGEAIPIEQRAADEIVRPFGKQSVPAGSPVYNPAFDVTPAELVTGYVTDRGIRRPPFD